MVIEPGAVATELTDHITDPGVKQAAQQMYEQVAITARTSPRSSPLPLPATPSDHERDPRAADRTALEEMTMDHRLLGRTGGDVRHHRPPDYEHLGSQLGGRGPAA